MSHLGYLMNAEIGEKVPPLENGKVPTDFLPVITPESINADAAGTSENALASHIRASNPHQQYSLITHTHTSASVGSEPLGAASDAVAAHEKAQHPHSQYSLANHTHTANSVGADALGTAIGLVAAHSNAADPHENYLNAPRLNALLTTKQWYNLTLVNGWTGVNAQYTKLSNGLILLSGLLSKSGKSVGEIIATLPVGYRPSTTVRFRSCDTAKDSQPYLDINSSGQIIFNNPNPPNNTIGLTLSGIIYVGS